MLTTGTSLPAPSPLHPLQTFVVMVTAPEGKSFCGSFRFFNKGTATLIIFFEGDGYLTQWQLNFFHSVSGDHFGDALALAFSVQL